MPSATVLEKAALRLVTEGEPETSQIACARECVWSTSVTYIRKFGAHIGAPDEISALPAESLFLEALVRW